MERLNVPSDAAIELSNGCVISGKTYLHFRKRYSIQRIAEEFGVAFEELIDRLCIELTLPLDEDFEPALCAVGEEVLINAIVGANKRLLAKAKVLAVKERSVTAQLLESCPDSGLNVGHVIEVVSDEVLKI